ncbi:frizzled-6-like [Megalobrama amblycephala]|uniref:frizzled-6-like n=1 Tax=Megalobrama amblycephala TaxID=75352 RepID=UPI0020147360|nr:frizzled-6-like [Megalobrama amblycephala]XP_048008904.1 frizzled-6-like [Megalobrama amblycephala]XP_048008905.1 frizzled-6-like [Megalobrama amblycephala]
MRILLWFSIAFFLLDSCMSHTLFTCEPVHVQWCHGMPYNTTFFPNMLEHYDQDIAAEKMKHFMPLASLRCSPDVHLFLCQAFVPECRDHTRVLRPCRELCERVRSDCSGDMLTFGISWPSELRCDRLESCRFSPDGSAVSAVEEVNMSRSSLPSGRDLGFWCPLQLKTRPGSFLGAQDCAPPCDNMYLEPHEVRFAKTFIGVSSVVCLCATLFTFLTFLIDVERFRYPERPIVFYSVCYSFVSLIYFVGFLLDDAAACSEPSVPGRVSTVVLGGRSRSCSLLFMLLYFSSTAGMVWWVILTITWFLAAGPKWSCEAIEKKAVWFHAVAWGLPAALTVVLLALNKVEGDGISGVCFVGLYDLAVLRWFVVAPLAIGVLVGLSLLLAGIVSLNHVRQVIQHDERNQEKLKKFMIRIGVFSGLYLLPLLVLLGCYLYEQAQRRTWENSWIHEHCQEYSIPCSSRSIDAERPELSLFLIKYLMTLVVGIPAVFWVSSKKTCSEWASFFKRTRKKDPISESRRVLQESCEFFLKHNSHVQHKSKHYKSSSHKLKVVSKSMGTSTGVHTPVSSNHDNTPVSTAIRNHCVPSQSVCDPPHSSEGLGSMVPTERRSKADTSSRISSRAESLHRLTPKDDVLEAGQSSAHCTSSQ